MILGIGNDIVEIDRIRKSYEKHKDHFLLKLFTENERQYCMRFSDPFPRIAGRFAVKEAIVKALGTGFGKEVSWQEIEVINNAQGKPEVFLHGSIKEKTLHTQIHVSISHCESFASAVAVWTKC
jgi:holo-[acyl-carrier protein] synthase